MILAGMLISTAIRDFSLYLRFCFYLFLLYVIFRNLLVASQSTPLNNNVPEIPTFHINGTAWLHNAGDNSFPQFRTAIALTSPKGKASESLQNYPFDS